MAKKKRKPHKKPMRTPLSKLDKFVYWATSILGLIISVVIQFIYAQISNHIAFSDISVIASSSPDAASILFLPLIFLIWVLSFFSIIYLYYDKKQPIFGNKNFNPPPNQPYVETPPIFSLKFWREMSKKTKSRLKKFIIVTTVLFSVFSALSLLGICQRSILDKVDNIKTYNSFNKLTSTYNIEKADKMIIDVGCNTGPKGGITSYYIEIVFVFGDEKFSFTQHSFNGMDRMEVLEYMLRKKSDINGKYEVRGLNLMEKLCKDRNFTEAEKALVYELFDYTE